MSTPAKSRQNWPKSPIIGRLRARIGHLGRKLTEIGPELDNSPKVGRVRTRIGQIRNKMAEVALNLVNFGRINRIRAKCHSTQRSATPSPDSDLDPREFESAPRGASMKARPRGKPHGCRRRSTTLPRCRVHPSQTHLRSDGCVATAPEFPGPIPAWNPNNGHLLEATGCIDPLAERRALLARVAENSCLSFATRLQPTAHQTTRCLTLKDVAKPSGHDAEVASDTCFSRYAGCAGGARDHRHIW